MQPSQHRYQHGLTLVELLIATTLGMFVVLIVTGLVVSTKSAQSIQNDAAIIQDTARYALDNISHTIRQAGYTNFDHDDMQPVDAQKITAGITGFDAGSLKATSYGIDTPSASQSSSDILAVRFFGSNIDNTVLNCAGFGVPATTEKERGWSIYYVSNDVDDEPALFCKFSRGQKFATQAIARGVESFQVLYGLSTHFSDNEVSTQFLNADQVTALDSEIPDAELNQKTHWKKITAVKVAILLRGSEDLHAAPSEPTYNLFGEAYGDIMGAIDKGTQIHASDIPLSQKKRLRKVVNTTIQLRNSMS